MLRSLATLNFEVSDKSGFRDLWQVLVWGLRQLSILRSQASPGFEASGTSRFGVSGEFGFRPTLSHVSAAGEVEDVVEDVILTHFRQCIRGGRGFCKKKFRKSNISFSKIHVLHKYIA